MAIKKTVSRSNPNKQLSNMMILNLGLPPTINHPASKKEQFCSGRHEANAVSSESAVLAGRPITLPRQLGLNKGGGAGLSLQQLPKSNQFNLELGQNLTANSCKTCCTCRSDMGGWHMPISAQKASFCSTSPFRTVQSSWAGSHVKSP